MNRCDAEIIEIIQFGWWSLQICSLYYMRARHRQIEMRGLYLFIFPDSALIVLGLWVLVPHFFPPLFLVITKISVREVGEKNHRICKELYAQ